MEMTGWGTKALPNASLDVTLEAPLGALRRDFTIPPKEDRVKESAWNRRG